MVQARVMTSRDRRIGFIVPAVCVGARGRLAAPPTTRLHREGKHHESPVQVAGRRLAVVIITAAALGACSDNRPPVSIGLITKQETNRYDGDVAQGGGETRPASAPVPAAHCRDGSSDRRRRVAANGPEGDVGQGGRRISSPFDELDGPRLLIRLRATRALP